MKQWIFYTLLALHAIGTSHASAPPKGDYVVILHGIVRSSSHMQPLANALKQQGYDVINIDYPSTEHPLETLTDIIFNTISRHTTLAKPVHYVGYSMGGLLVRTIIEKHQPAQLGRVVQLAPPNHGSEVADFLKNNWFYQKIYGPAGQQLTTHNSATQKLLGHVTYELGIIAGNSSIDPFSSYLINGNDDGKVSINSTKVNGMQDHVIVPASHSFFPSNQKVHQQTIHFLKSGTFAK